LLRRGHIEGRGNEGAVTKASKDLGIDRETVRRAVAAESLPDAAKAAADAAGLGTVARATAAREPTPDAQAARMDAAVRHETATLAAP
jgi:hypothetical protein